MIKKLHSFHNCICFWSQHLRRTPSKMGTPARSEKAGAELNWLERWMATKPWESRLMEEFQRDEGNISGSFSTSSDSTRARRHNLSTRTPSKVPMSCQILRSSSDPCSDSMYNDETTTSNSSTTTSETTPESKPSYMSLTRSTKAKQRPCAYGSNSNSNAHSLQRHSVEDLPLRRKPSPLSKGNARRSADVDLYSVDLCKDLYPPAYYAWIVCASQLCFENFLTNRTSSTPRCSWFVAFRFVCHRFKVVLRVYSQFFDGYCKVLSDYIELHI